MASFFLGVALAMACGQGYLAERAVKLLIDCDALCSD